MPKDKDFWKRLMGEPEYDDFIRQDEVGEPEAPEAVPKIEYISKDGKPFREEADISEKPASSNTGIFKRGKKREYSEELMGPKNFAIDFDFDKEYNDEHEKPIQRQRVKRTGCIGGILYFLFIVCVSFVLASIGWMATTDVLGFGDADELVEITLEKSIFSDKQVEETDESGNTTMKTVKSADIAELAKMLHERGLIKYEWLFKLYSRFSHADMKVQAGTYELNKNYDYRALVYGMNPASGTRVEIEVTVPEGYNLQQIIALLAKNRVCTEEDLWDAAANYNFEYDFLSASTLGDKYRLEGFLFPDTYKFYVNDTPSRVLGKFLTDFKNRWSDDFTERAEEIGYSVRDIVTIASMIEKEAGADSERDKIASVIYNRLESDSFPNIQIDATIVYGMARNGDSGKIATDYNSPYNTYICEGLPPGPISNPGTASIRAALYAEDTRYYYYALGLEGVHEFFTNQSDFEAFVNSDKYGG